MIGTLMVEKHGISLRYMKMPRCIATSCPESKQKIPKYSSKLLPKGMIVHCTVFCGHE